MSGAGSDEPNDHGHDEWSRRELVLCILPLALFAYVLVHFHPRRPPVDDWRLLLSAPLSPYPMGDPTSCGNFQNLSNEQCYGEVDDGNGYEELANGFPSECQMNASSSFVDIGSGVGRLALFMRLYTNVSKVTGLELNGCRVHRAQRMQREVLASWAKPAQMRGLSYRRGDVREEGFGDSTHAFMSTTCFGHNLIRDIFKEARSAPRLQCIVAHATSFENLIAAESAINKWGHVVGATPVTGSWALATALFIRRGECRGIHCQLAHAVNRLVSKLERDGSCRGRACG